MPHPLTFQRAKRKQMGLALVCAESSPVFSLLAIRPKGDPPHQSHKGLELSSELMQKILFGEIAFLVKNSS